MVRGRGALGLGGGVNYVRRQQHRRLLHAGRLGVASAMLTVLAGFVVSMGVISLAAMTLIVAVVLGLRAYHWLCLAERSRVGARSERDVRRALVPLQEHAWRLRHGLQWEGSGDIDSVAVAPNGVGFAIETKARSYDERHLARVLEQARWLRRRRRRWCRRGAIPVLCMVRAARVERYERSVLVVSIDRLVPVLWDLANDTGRRPESV